MWDYMFGRHLNGGSLMGPDLPRSSSSTFIWRGVVGGPAARHAGMWRTWYQLSHQSAPKSIRSWATHNTTYKAALLTRPVQPPVTTATTARAAAVEAKWKNWLIFRRTRPSPELTAQRNICLW
jgi:hypothetical protein